MRSTTRAVVVGAGMGGLSAAIRLARHGFEVTVLEARGAPGGLASSQTLQGMTFDAGPYVLLDRPGLEWAFQQLGLELETELSLRRIPRVYETSSPSAPTVCIDASLEETAAGLEATWPGTARKYRRFIEGTQAAWARMQPLQRVSRPGPGSLLRTGAWRDLPFLLRSLDSTLRRSGLAPVLRDALGIWTHVAGQEMTEAPSPLALVAGLIHDPGAYLPRGGISRIPEILARAARTEGVTIRVGTRVREIRTEHGCVRGVVDEEGELVPAEIVVANPGGFRTYLELLGRTPERERRRLRRLPRQSPGLCAYLRVRGNPAGPYLRFRLPGGGQLCRLLVTPGAVFPDLEHEGWLPARLIAPMRYAEAQAAAPERASELLDELLQESWWREHFTQVEVLGRRTPLDWGRDFHLWENCMNPVMTARLMLEGRLPHRSPHARGLYLSGSSTHPGQWVSFCAISGILAADLARKDLG